MLAVLLLAGAAMSYASSVAYTYDPAGRLVTADYGANRTASYAYDNAGNLLQTATPTPGLTIKLSGNLLILSWPISPAGFGLFSSSSLGAGAPWSSVGGEHLCQWVRISTW